ncbi:MAG: 2-isopropylmalate synthase [Bacteroidetes bacterium]|nr:2-isopropylmalate synthase [Bacteroidota bacterium]
MKDKIFIFDTTLRDGEQSPGCSMNTQEKLKMARQLEALNVDVIEAGFPMASEGDFEAVREVAKTIKGCTIAALSRATTADIDRAFEALQYAAKPRIHVFIATSDIHLKHKLKRTRQQVLEQSVNTVAYAKKLSEDVEFSCEDASRSDIDYLCQIIEAVINSGANVVNLPDTVGYSIPQDYGSMIKTIRERVKNIDKAILSVHCHNDLGLAVANSIAAVMNGARQVECTVNGIGERAGNASLEEFVMALRTRPDVLPFEVDVNTEEIFKSSRLLSTMTGMMVQRNKAIVGANAFSHEAGIHQDGIIKSRMTYEIMTPESVGIKHSTLVLGKHSGRHALRQRFEELGYSLTTEELDNVYVEFTRLADKKKEILDEDLMAILNNKFESDETKYVLSSLQVMTGTGVKSTAVLELNDGKETYVDSATGDGPVDAAYNAIERITKMNGQLVDYTIKSVTWGGDAVGEVFVKVIFNNIVFTGHAASTDIVTGSVEAYLQAVNRALSAKSSRSAEETMIKNQANAV